MTSIGRENLVGVIFQPGTLKSSWYVRSLLPGSPKTHSSATEASAPTLGGQLTPLSSPGHYAGPTVIKGEGRGPSGSPA